MMPLGLAQRSHRPLQAHTKQVMRHRIKNWDETPQCSHGDAMLFLQKVSSNSICVSGTLEGYKRACNKSKPIATERKDKG